MEQTSSSLLLSLLLTHRSMRALCQCLNALLSRVGKTPEHVHPAIVDVIRRLHQLRIECCSRAPPTRTPTHPHARPRARTLHFAPTRAASDPKPTPTPNPTRTYART